MKLIYFEKIPNHNLSLLFTLYDVPKSLCNRWYLVILGNMILKIQETSCAKLLKQMII